MSVWNRRHEQDDARSAIALKKEIARCSECGNPIDDTFKNYGSITCSVECHTARDNRIYADSSELAPLGKTSSYSICSTCGASYKTNSVPIGWKYCSKPCRNEYREKKRIEAKIKAHEITGKTLPERVCLECGKVIDFTVRHGRSRTCSLECQRARAKRKAPNPAKYISNIKIIERGCSECGANIDFGNRGTSAVTCSLSCAEKRRARLYELKKSTPQPDSITSLSTSHSFYRGDRERGFTLKPYHCIYCGDWYQCRDHIVPILVDAVERSYDPEKTCHCCNLCNKLAGDYWAESIEDKAQHILSRYRRKFRVILFQNSWSDTELDDLMGGLHEFVRSKQNLKRLIEAKIDNLLRVSSGIEAIRLNDDVFYGSWGQG